MTIKNKAFKVFRKEHHFVNHITHRCECVLQDYASEHPWILHGCIQRYCTTQ